MTVDVRSVSEGDFPALAGLDLTYRTDHVLATKTQRHKDSDYLDSQCLSVFVFNAPEELYPTLGTCH